MGELLRYAFEKLDADVVELNVFDWNVAGIRCYEVVGFVLNPDKKQTLEVNGKIWQALNMTIEKNRWSKLIAEKN
jgi:RimJ/RimL family protein N-acetyltransferase